MGHGKVLAQLVSLGLVPHCVSGSWALGQGYRLPSEPTYHTSPELMGARVSTRGCSVLSWGVSLFHPTLCPAWGLGTQWAGFSTHSLAPGRARITSGHSAQVAPPGAGPPAPPPGPPALGKGGV